MAEAPKADIRNRPDPETGTVSGIPMRPNPASSTSHANQGVPTVKPVSGVKPSDHKGGLPSKLGLDEDQGDSSASIDNVGEEGGPAPESVDERASDDLEEVTDESSDTAGETAEGRSNEQ